MASKCSRNDTNLSIISSKFEDIVKKKSRDKFIDIEHSQVFYNIKIVEKSWERTCVFFIELCKVALLPSLK